MIRPEATPASHEADHLAALAAICGADGVDARPAALRLASMDLFFEGAVPMAIVSPASTDAVAAVVRYCSAQGLALCPRGGGMSYSDAFQPQSPRTIMLDFHQLAAIRAIAVEDGHVTVEAGCTWAALDAALAPHGVRARFWGPVSGATATIGGSLSQGAVTFGSGEVGASAMAVKSFEIVTGAGDILHTGSDAAATLPCNRNFGPDLTGLFANDAGALGIKTAVTLELCPRPALVSGLSFAFDEFAPMARMLGAVGRERLASELMAMDAEVARQQAGAPDLMADARALWRIGRAAGTPWAGLSRMVRVGLGGRRFLDRAAYTAHVVVEGRDRGALASRLAAIRALAAGGREIVNSVPLAMRAMPFPALPVTHPDGRRLLPIHGIFPTSAILDFHHAYQSLKRARAGVMAEHRVSIAEFFAGVAGVGTLYEPVFYWPDALSDYHRERTPDWLTGKLPPHAENPAGRALVRALAGEIIALMRRHGSTHFQIGRLYPGASARQDGSGDLLRALKRELDPAGILNPGALEL